MSETVNDYRSAKAFLGDKDRRKLDRNTYLERRGPKTIAVRLHDTDIVIFTPTYTQLNTGGWHTKTTANRMRQYIPGDIGNGYGNRTRGWQWYPIAEIACHCARDGRNRAWPGLEERFTGKWTGEPYDHDGGSKPIYEWQTCSTCHGTGKRVGIDYENGGYVFFDGIRIHPSGTRLMAGQPLKPKDWQPVVTVSGWSGQPNRGRRMHEPYWKPLAPAGRPAYFGG